MFPILNKNCDQQAKINKNGWLMNRKYRMFVDKSPCIQPINLKRD